MMALVVNGRLLDSFATPDPDLYDLCAAQIVEVHVRMPRLGWGACGRGAV